VAEAMAQWARDVEAASNGEVKVSVQTTALGRPQQHFELARDGVADIALGIQGYTPGRFVLAAVGGIPDAGNYSESLGAGYWRTLQKYPEMQKEYEGVTVLGVFSTTPMSFFSAKGEVKSPGDFSGLKVHTAGGMMADVATSLGMVPVVQPPQAAYEVLSNGVVDSIILTTDGIVAFKLDRLIKNALIVPGGLSSAQGFLVMNTAKFNSLSPAAQAALRKVSGENFARLVGRLWDQRDARGVAALKEAGARVATADPALRDGIFKRTERAIDAWLKEVSEKRGMDGRPLLATYRAEIEAVEKEIRARQK
jgi:TRAP-type C4-dicarboxylate transport system substrate-binding protein